MRRFLKNLQLRKHFELRPTKLVVFPALKIKSYVPRSETKLFRAYWQIESQIHGNDEKAIWTVLGYTHNRAELTCSELLRYG